MAISPSGPSSFGALLQAYRKRRRLTQQQLAERLGLRRNTVGDWERGTFLPASKGIVLELVRHLHLDDQEARQLLEASLTALAPPFEVPLPRNLFFTGREEILSTLHTQLSSEHSVALTQSWALHGLGGVGKTQIALEYAYRHALDYRALFWIGAETSESIVSSFLRIAQILQLPEHNENEQQRVVTAVQRWLSSQSGWLLIWDNIEDFDLLQQFLPPPWQGAILLTTRRQAVGTWALGLPLSPWTREEGLSFLLRRSKLLPLSAHPEQLEAWCQQQPQDALAARELVALMDGLPLALDQAGAYIEETGCSLLAYREYYEQRRATLLAQRGSKPADHPASVVTTLQLSCSTVAQQSAVAMELLRFCAFLAPEEIAEEILTTGAAQLGPVLAPIAPDTYQLSQIMQILRAYSLVQRDPTSRTLSIHRLVQAVLQDSLSAEEQRTWAHRAMLAVNAVFPHVEYGTWSQCERLLTQALYASQWISRYQMRDEQAARLLFETASYLHCRGRYQEAEPLFQQALHIREQLLGADHPLVASSLNHLANLYRNQSKYAQAELLLQRALHIWEQQVSPDHPDVISSLNNLAALYYDWGKYAQAEPLFQRALHMREQQVGADHSDLAFPLNGLANIYSEQGKDDQAEPLYQRAIRIRERQLGSDHPDVASPLNNLASHYLQQGKYAQAEPLYQRALYILEQANPDHPNVAYPLYGMANLYWQQGKYAQAEPLYQRALYIWKQQGSEHAGALNGLANLYRDQGKYSQAESLYQRALCIREHQLIPQHPNLAKTLHDLATFHQVQGHLQQALSFYQRALIIREQAYGASHPRTIETCKRLHAVLAAVGKAEEVTPLEGTQHNRSSTEKEQST